MARLKYWTGRLRALCQPQRVHDEIAEEMALHIELRTDENIRGGMTPEEARKEAQQRFGHLTQLRERGYEVRGGGWVESVVHDVAYAVRLLRQAPGFSVIALLSLALGIGANTAIFSLLDAALLKMLPVKNPEELVFITATLDPKGKQTSYVPYAFFQELQQPVGPFSAACSSISGLKVSVGKQPEIAYAELVSGNYFSVLGVNAFLGRTFTDADDQVPGGHSVAILSYRYWKQRFAKDASIVGKPIMLNGHPLTVIGVTPPEFFGLTVGSSTDIWVPSMMRSQIQPGRLPWAQDLTGVAPMVLARLAPGVTEQRATTLLSELWHQFLKEATGTMLSEERKRLLQQQGIQLMPASRGFSSLRSQFSQPLYVLTVLVALVLLIACVNVANLLLARSAARRKEIAVRLSLGARRSRILRQLLTESFLLAFVAGALGLLLAFWAGHFLLALVSSGRAPVFLVLKVDGSMLGYTAAISLVSACVFGVAPAMISTRLEPVHALNHPAGTSPGGSRQGLRKALVAAQVALSLLLLICAGLFIRTLQNLRSLDVGFNPENVLVFSTDPRLVGYQEKQVAQLYQEMLDRISAVPGVASASLARNGLLSGGGSYSNVLVIGPHLHADDDERDDHLVFENLFSEPAFSPVGPRFFETSGIPILRGRDIGPQDTGQSSQVAVINEAFARYYFGTADPIGRHFMGGANPNETEIVGVARDEKYRTLRQDAPRTFYIPYLQDPSSWRDTNFQVRTQGNPSDMIPAILQAVHELNQSLPVYGVKTLDQQVDQTLVQERLVSTLSSFFALLCLLQAAIGIYGLTAYGVSQRTQEIGTRMALGAKPGDVLRMVLLQGMALVLAGIILGLVLAVAATRVIAHQLFHVTAMDPLTFFGAPLVFLAVALAACIGPSLRASKVDPMIALRCE